MSFSKYSIKKDTVPSSTSKLGRALLALLFVMMFVIMGAGEGRTYEGMPEWWQKAVRKLKAEGKDVKIMKSKNMTPEKSPEEFLQRYKQVREEAGDNFTFRTFVEDVARGLLIEQRYHETQGVHYPAKENLNPNYYWSGGVLVFQYDKFCITPELLRNVFGEEDRIVTYLTKKSTSYSYDFIGINFEVDFISLINKKCAIDAGINTGFFYKMENREQMRREN